MAITDTIQAKEFTAGAPDITLKGDLNPNKMMAGSSRYQMILEELINEMEDRLGRPITNEEYDQLGKEAYDRLFESSVSKEKNQMMASYGYDDAMGEAFEEFLRLKKIKEIPADMEFDEYLDLLDIDIPYSKKQEQAPSTKLAELDYDNIMKIEDKAFQNAMDRFKYYQDMKGKKNFRDYLREAGDEGEMFRGADGGRAKYGLGSLVKSVKKAVKGVVKGVKDNPLLAAAALNFAPMLIPGGKAMFFGPAKSSIFGNPLSLLNLSGAESGTGAAMDALKIGGTGAVITGLLAEREQQEGESDIDYAQRRAQVNDQLNVQFKRLYPKGEAESDQDYEVRINSMVEAADDSTLPVGEMAEGGRVGYAMGTDDKVKMAAGIEGLPININPKGVKELDLRETGGFIPPVGVKEKADDIPAMLSNNEFVFTADAVRAAGGGSVNKGAQRMYDLMKNLESKVV